VKLLSGKVEMYVKSKVRIDLPFVIIKASGMLVHYVSCDGISEC
jgi:hypothetical protein